MASRECPPRCTCGKHKAGPKVAKALRGRTLPPEHRAAIGQGMAGYVPSDEHRARLAESKRGDRNPMKRPEVAAEAQVSKAQVISSPTTELEKQAARRGIRVPRAATAKHYGLTVEEWLALLAAQGWRCPICLKGSATTLWNTDHDHVPAWKRKPREERRRYVRGVLCAHCNWKRVDSRMSAAEAARIAAYLAAYEARRDA